MQMHTIGGPQSLVSGLAAFLPAIRAKAFKEALGDEIERLIELADAIDGDADLEAENEHGDNADDEPSLGSLNGTAPLDFTPRKGPYSATQVRWAESGRADAELDESDDEDGHDREASDLAHVGVGGNLEGDDCDLKDGGDTELNGDELDGVFNGNASGTLPPSLRLAGRHCLKRRSSEATSARISQFTRKPSL